MKIGRGLGGLEYSARKITPFRRNLEFLAALA